MQEKDWLEHYRYYDSLNEDRLKSIFYFSLVWNIFENKLCMNDANIGRDPRSIAISKVESVDSELVNRIFAYFQTRYVENGRMTDVFIDFEFRSDEYKTFVFDSFLNPSSSLKDKIQALLYIAFRLRNNLFHGIKDVSKLYEQNKNFEQINQLLMELLGDS